MRRDVAKANNDDLLTEIEEIRERLAGTVDDLIDRTNPKNIARRRLNDAKAHFIDANGSPRLENIVPVVLGAAGVIGVLVLIRKIVR